MYHFPNVAEDENLLGTCQNTDSQALVQNYRTRIPRGEAWQSDKPLRFLSGKFGEH